MPRYYFNFSDGECIFTDAIGVELVGIAAVRKRVIKQVRDLKGSQSQHHIQDWSDWKMIVIDAKGKTVLEVGFDLAPTPINKRGHGWNVH
jgi:hypothetical protein